MKIIDNYNLKYSSLLDLFLLIVIVIIFFKIFILHEHYPLHDEVISLDRYLEPKNFIRRDSTNNQLFLSFFGMLINFIYGFEFILFRMISFISFVSIIIILRNSFSKFIIYFVFFIIILSSDLLFNYTYLYRGYYVGSFLLILNLHLLKKYFHNNAIQFLKYSFLTTTLLFIHSIYTVYFIIPILMTVFIKTYVDKKFINIKICIIYFIIPSIILYSLIFIITGFAQAYSGNLNFSFLINNLFEVSLNSFLPGLKTVFFQDATKLYFSFSALFEKLTKGESGIMTTHQITILLIIIISIINLIYKLIFKRLTLNYFDCMVGIFFIIYFLINRNPWLRVFVPISFFLVFYLLNEINLLMLKINKNHYKVLIISTSIIFSILILLAKPNENYNQLKNEIAKIDKVKDNCSLANSKLNNYEIWIMINFYPNSCKYYYNNKLKKNILID